MSNNPYESYEMSGTTPQMAFYNEVENVKHDLVQYEDNIDRIEGLHKRSLALADVEGQDEIENQIEKLKMETRGLGDALKQRIQALLNKSQNDPTKRSQTENLKRQFTDLIAKFRRVEATAQNQYRDVEARQYRIVQPEATDAEVDQALDSNQQVFTQALLNSNRRGQARAALSEVEMRHQAVRKIEESMAELAQLFQDMETLVAEQDHQVTEVDNNVAKAQTDIQGGVQHQQRAIRSARRARKLKWICLIILIIIAIVLIATLSGVLIPRGNH